MSAESRPRSRKPGKRTLARRITQSLARTPYQKREVQYAMHQAMIAFRENRTREAELKVDIGGKALRDEGRRISRSSNVDPGQIVRLFLKEKRHKKQLRDLRRDVRLAEKGFRITREDLRKANDSLRARKRFAHSVIGQNLRRTLLFFQRPKLVTSESLRRQKKWRK